MITVCHKHNIRYESAAEVYGMCPKCYEDQYPSMEPIGIVNLSEVTDNPAHWTAEDAVQFAVRDVEDFDYAIVILAKHKTKSDGSESFELRTTMGGLSLDNLKAIGILDMAKDYLRACFDGLGFIAGENE